MNGISPQLQNQITQYQQTQQQLQTVSTQKVQMESQKREMVRTSDELGKSTGDVYKNVGSLLVKVDDKDKLKAEIDDSIETMEIRIKGLDRQEKSLREKYDALQNAINAAMGQQPISAPNE
ncbi:MAG: prefoldin subunit beta [Candidatus Methanomethylophilaceae archaeon]|nr:prefoldin subunit beta [Candidatus Methanomethylophilaceae archaeon]